MYGPAVRRKVRARIHSSAQPAYASRQGDRVGDARSQQMQWRLLPATARSQGPQMALFVESPGGMCVPKHEEQTQQVQ
jgi:hypothetical protein